MNLMFSPTVSSPLPDNDERRVWFSQQINSRQDEFLVHATDYVSLCCTLGGRIEGGGGGGKGRTIEDSSTVEFRRSPGRSDLKLRRSIQGISISIQTYIGWSWSSIHTWPDGPLKVSTYQLHWAWTGSAIIFSLILGKALVWRWEK